MYIQNISIKRVIRSKIFYLSLIGIIIIVIILAVISSKLEKKMFGEKIDNIIEYFYDGKVNIFDLTSYYIEYDATVVSNKNVNTYSFKEWYKDEDKYRFEFLDYEKNIVTIISNNNDIYIKNSNQKNYMVIKEYINDTHNLMSLKTFINIYNKVNTQKHSCDCNVKSYEKKGEVIITISGSCNYSSCEICNITNSLGKNIELQLVIDKRTGVPKTYTVYDVNKKEKICIVYNRVEINIQNDDELFKI